MQLYPLVYVVHWLVWDIDPRFAAGVQCDARPITQQPLAIINMTACVPKTIVQRADHQQWAVGLYLDHSKEFGTSFGSVHKESSRFPGL